jgi:Uma2 family endonuclease
MTLMTPAVPSGAAEYPDDDGKPMSDNSKQFRWIGVLYGNIAAVVHDRPDVLVAGNMLWYAREGFPEDSTAPDVMVIYGRPKGDRGSYKQWEENNIPATVVFEILSPGNTATEMIKKFEFYDEQGVEEYYIYDPENNRFHVFVRQGEVLVRVRKVENYVSPRLGIRFDLSGPEMVVYYPNGRRFLTLEELEAERARTEQRAEHAEQRAEHAEQRAEHAEQRAVRLAALTRRVLAQQATAEELQELQRLLENPSSTDRAEVGQGKSP